MKNTNPTNINPHVALCVAFITALLAAGQSLSAESFQLTDRFRGSVYLTGTNPPELIFMHENDMTLADGKNDTDAHIPEN